MNIETDNEPESIPESALSRMLSGEDIRSVSQEIALYANSMNGAIAKARKLGLTVEIDELFGRVVYRVSQELVGNMDDDIDAMLDWEPDSD